MAKSRSLYVDGVLAGTTASQDGNGGGELWVGNDKGVGEFINGTVDDVRVYGRALSPTEIQALTASTNPAAPNGLVTSNGGASTITLGWNDNANNERAFTIDRSTDGVYFSQLAQVPANTTTFTDNSLGAIGTYYYRVRALSVAGASANSAVVAYSNDPSLIPPVAPSSLVAVAGSPTEIDLLWVDNATNETNFKVERSSDGATFTQLALLGPNATGYQDKSAGAGGSFTYRVRASNSTGDSPYSATAFASTLEYGDERPPGVRRRIGRHGRGQHRSWPLGDGRRPEHVGQWATRDHGPGGLRQRPRGDPRRARPAVHRGAELLADDLGQSRLAPQ